MPKNAQSDAILRLTHANVHLAKGAARAAATGFENFAKKLDHDNIFLRDIGKNGFVLGLLEGWTAALFEGAKLADEAFQVWRREMEGGTPRPRRGAK